MLIESGEAFRHLPAAAFNDLGDDCTGVVEPDLCGNTADILKDRLQSFQKAFGILTVVQLEIGTVAVGKTENKVFAFFMKFPIFVEGREPEVGLAFSRTVNQWNVGICFLQLQLLFLRGHIFCGQAVTAVVARDFLFQSLVDLPGCMPLFSRRTFFSIADQPLVNEWFEGIEL